MNNNELSRIVHSEIIQSFDEIPYNLKRHLEDINASENDQIKAREYFDRIRNQVIRSLIAREMMDSKLENLRKECEK